MKSNLQFRDAVCNATDVDEPLAVLKSPGCAALLGWRLGMRMREKEMTST